MKKIFDNFGIYVHVPFCARACGYCRFYKKIPSQNDIDTYIESITEELKLFKQSENKELSVDTMFWGGGTPSILSERQIENLAKTFANTLPTQEWTVEVSPSTITKSKLETFKNVGVNRISLGVQSFSEKTLQTLGRAHSLKDTLEAIELVSNADFEKFSIDLIFGADGQTVDDFCKDIESAATTSVDHISAYCLEFESGTSACAGLKTQQQLEKNYDDAQLFQTAMQLLPELGFAQYEISNYARNSQARCLHNLSTWNMAQWVGLGPSAASQFNGRRYRNKSSIAKWIDGIRNASPSYDDVVILDDEEMFSSALIFGLRMNEGVNLQELHNRFPNADFEKYQNDILRLQEENLIERNREKIALTFEGRLVADYVAVELL